MLMSVGSSMSTCGSCTAASLTELSTTSNWTCFRLMLMQKCMTTLQALRKFTTVSFPTMCLLHRARMSVLVAMLHVAVIGCYNSQFTRFVDILVPQAVATALACPYLQRCAGIQSDRLSQCCGCGVLLFDKPLRDERGIFTSISHKSAHAHAFQLNLFQTLSLTTLSTTATCLCLLPKWKAATSQMAFHL